MAERNEKKAGNSGDVIQVARFRSMKKGDLVIVPDGNLRFRAIGEVAGDYEFTPGTLGGNHRRAVEWLLKLADPLPVETIYNARFAMAACYQLYSSEVKKAALEELLRPPAVKGEPIGDGLPYVLIVDEINRANISKVLGELITLLEPDKRLGAENEITVTLPYSRARFGVPKNLYMIGTMNTADRSIAPLDTALRRRFEFKQLMPDYEVLKGKQVDGIPLDGLLRAINDRIEWLFDHDHLLGHAYLIHVQTREELDRTMRSRVVPLLAEYFFEDWAKVRSALNDHGGWFVAQGKLGRPAMEEDEGRTRFRYDLQNGPIPQQAYEAVLGASPGAAGA